MTNISNFTISPYNGEPGYLCLPLVRNIPTRRNHNWRMVRCPSCGADCWLTLSAKVAIKRSKGKLQGVCTECALRAGMKAGAESGKEV